MFAALALAGVFLAVLPASADSGELLYVASADAGPVTAFPVGSHGGVEPVVSVADPDVAGTVWDPWGVAFDRSGELYVQSFLSDATTFVYPDGSGVGGPSRIFVAVNPDARAIALDSAGYEYIPGSEGASEVAVVGPRAAGSPASFYDVQPVRTITTDQGSFAPWPDIVTVDGHDDLVVAVGRARDDSTAGNAIEVFAGGPAAPKGSTRPIATISGPATGLGTCDDSGCDQVSVAYSPFNGEIYASVSSGHAGVVTHLSAFRQGSSGDVAPVHTIEGPATGLTGKVVTGLAVSGLTGTLYAMVRTAQFAGSGQVESFRGTDHGNAAPVASFSDERTGFADAEGIAISYPTAGTGLAETAFAPAIPAVAIVLLGGAFLLRRRRLSQLNRGARLRV